MPLRIYLVRHAETEASTKGVLQGREEFDLSQEGCFQAQQLVCHFSDILIDRVLTSPLRRAIDTALPIANSKGITLEKCDWLNAFDIGELSGLKKTEAVERWPGIFDRPLKDRLRPFPGGESFEDFSCRIRSDLNLITADALEKNNNILIVSHTFTLNEILSCLLDMSPQPFSRFVFDFASLAEVCFRSVGGEHKAKLLRLNFTTISQRTNVSQ